MNDQVNDLSHSTQSQYSGSAAPYANQQLLAASRPQSPDAVVQNAFAQMLQSPTQMQRLLAALASQSINPMHEQPPSPPGMQLSQQLQPYDPPIDYSRAYNLDQSNPPFAPASSLPIVSPPLNQSDGVVSFDHIAEDENRLQRTYSDVAEINEDVEALHTRINSLLESLGFDPEILASSHGQDAQSHEQSSVNPHDTLMSSETQGNQSQSHEQSSVNPHNTLISSGLNETQGDQSQDFDFDAFLTDLTQGDGDTDYTHFADKLDPSARSEPINDPSPEQLPAFLDEVVSPSDGTVSPISFRHDSPDVQPKRSGKRKSDVAGILTEDQSTGKRAGNHATKLKRKK